MVRLDETLEKISDSEKGKYLRGCANIADYAAREAAAKSFSVPYSEHVKLIEKFKLVEAHIEIILYAIEGQLKCLAGDTAPLQALQEVTENVIILASELGGTIEKLRPEKKTELLDISQV